MLLITVLLGSYAAVAAIVYLIVIKQDSKDKRGSK